MTVHMLAGAGAGVYVISERRDAVIDPFRFVKFIYWK